MMAETDTTQSSKSCYKCTTHTKAVIFTLYASEFIIGSTGTAKSFLRSLQLLHYSRISQHIMEPKGSWLCSQEPTLVPILSQTNPVHSTPPYFSKHIFILSSHQHPGLPIGPFLLTFPPKYCMHSFSPHACYMPCPAPPSLDNSNYIWQRVHIMNLHIMQFSPTSYYYYYYLIPLTIPIFSLAPFSQTLSVHILPLISTTKFHTHSKLQAKLWFYTF
jgi:hypothetical protein